MEHPYRCPRCGWSDSRLSRPAGIVDAALAPLLLVPIRCRKCLNRFYRFRTTRAKYAVAAMMLGTLVLLSLSYNWVATHRHGRTNHPTSGEADRRR